MTKNNSNWLEIEEGFVHFCNVYNFSVADRKAILAHFKPYFQEQRHEESVRELEDEYPLYKKEYNELPEIVDNSKQ